MSEQEVRPTVAGIIEENARRVLRDMVRGTVAGEVVGRDVSANTVDVRVLVADEDVATTGGRLFTEPPVVTMPLARFGHSAALFTIFPAVGATGLVHFRGPSHDEVDDGVTGQTVAPASPRTFDLADAYFVPTILVSPPASSASDSNPVLYMESGRSLQVGGSGANQLLALAAGVRRELEDIASTLTSATAPSSGGPLTFPDGPYAAPSTDAAIGTDRILVDE